MEWIIWMLVGGALGACITIAAMVVVVGRALRDFWWW
jgi:hypothetical protein